MGDVVAVTDLCKSYGEVRALRDVSFTLAGPQLVGILGPNGAGKTTLLDILEGLAMARYRQSLFLKKLATTPLRKTTFIAAQVAARAILVFLQMVLLVAAAALLLDLPVSPWGLAALTVVTTVGLVTFMGVGFALACVIRNDALLADVINGLLSPLVLCSDMFFPVSALPRPLAVVAGALPTTQLVRAVRAILLHGVNEVGPLLPELGLLVVWMVATYAVSLRVFRWHNT